MRKICENCKYFKTDKGNLRKYCGAKKEAYEPYPWETCSKWAKK